MVNGYANASLDRRSAESHIELWRMTHQLQTVSQDKEAFIVYKRRVDCVFGIPSQFCDRPSGGFESPRVDPEAGNPLTNLLRLLSTMQKFLSSNGYHKTMYL